MGELLTQLRAFYDKLSIIQKGVLLGSILAALAGFTALFLWPSEAEFRPLFTNLTPEDAAAITTKLKEERVPYRILAGGSSIAVPAEQVYESRLRMASQGLPQGGGVGFELFDRANFGTTSFVQRLNYQRALQGELARTISQLAAVEHARVHIAIPQKSVFLEEQQKPSASVVVKLRPAEQLSKSQIQGISHLIASSVEGLQPSQITIVDTAGRMLAGGEERNGLGQLSTAQLEFQYGLERELERKIQSLLERAVGQEKVSTRVSAAVDFQRVESTHEVFDPNSTVVRSEQRGTEKSSGSGFSPSGPPGVASNVPGAQAATPQLSNSSEMQKQNETINYEVSKSIRRVVEPTGKVKRLSAAVLIDGTYKDGAYVPRSDTEMRRYQTLAKTAMGFDEARGDQLEVINVAFDGVQDREPYKREVSPEAFWISIGKGLGIPLVALVLLFLFLRSLLKRFAPLPTEVVLPRELSRSVAELGAGLPAEGLPAVGLPTEGLPTDEFELEQRLEEAAIAREEADIERDEATIGRVEETIARRTELASRREDIARRRREEIAKRRVEEFRRREEAIRQELLQRQEEARLQADGEVRRQEEEVRQRQEAARRAQEAITEQQTRTRKLAKEDALRAATVAREWLREG